MKQPGGKLLPLQKLLTNDLRLLPRGWNAGDEAGFNKDRARDLAVYDGYLFCGILGGEEPSRYSESPRLWNPWFRAAGIRAVFLPFDLPREERVPEFVRRFLAVPGSLDLTVTNPWKAAAFRALTGETPAPAPGGGTEPGRGPEPGGGQSIAVQADIRFAAHTIRFDDRVPFTGVLNHLIRDEAAGTARALNTDGIGMADAIRRRVPLAGCRTLLIGAGGAATAVAYELVSAGAVLHIANWKEEETARLVALLRRFDTGAEQAGRARLTWGGLADVAARAREAELIVSAVTAGDPLTSGDARRIPPGVLFADTRYGDSARFARLGRETGHTSIDGKEMLFGQFASAADRVREILSIPDSVHRNAIESVRSGFLGE